MDILAVLYSVSGVVFGAAFLPQIVRLIQDRSGADSISLSMWTMFVFCSVISLLYACMHNGDIYFIFCNAIALTGNISILLLAAFRRISKVASKRFMEAGAVA